MASRTRFAASHWLGRAPRGRDRRFVGVGPSRDPIGPEARANGHDRGYAAALASGVGRLLMAVGVAGVGASTRRLYGRSLVTNGLPVLRATGWLPDAVFAPKARVSFRRSSLTSL